ncbi:MAG: hypothetical protein Q4B85_06610 [Lachnospiraceae bacterium]|nr:hypothetical protein [Lachnospiraceae bacterium]
MKNRTVRTLIAAFAVVAALGITGCDGKQAPAETQTDSAASESKAEEEKPEEPVEEKKEETEPVAQEPEQTEAEQPEEEKTEAQINAEAQASAENQKALEEIAAHEIKMDSPDYDGENTIVRVEGVARLPVSASIGACFDDFKDEVGVADAKGFNSKGDSFDLESTALALYYYDEATGEAVNAMGEPIVEGRDYFVEVYLYSETENVRFYQGVEVGNYINELGFEWAHSDGDTVALKTPVFHGYAQG